MECLRIYADANGESHFEDIDIPLVPMGLFPGVAPIHLSAWETATSVRFGWVPAGLKIADWHTTPVRQFVIWLSGCVEFETSDGETRHREPGAVVLVGMSSAIRVIGLANFPTNRIDQFKKGSLLGAVADSKPAMELSAATKPPNLEPASKAF